MVSKAGLGINIINEVIRKTLFSIPVVSETHPYAVSLIEKAQDEKADFLYHAPTFIIVSNLKDNIEIIRHEFHF
ncbi:hypothetical protein Gferi_23780 [Geosporobacter ferrireducens]|uniref:Uncharacterized protein n=1 Tax=Geosporobacter ferrireducens TaxID=1424294 RepID=A0A1D8GN05_9FIRM|nr:hypothetical protein Gferi_23780 [Geosporobacter ferrireducens]